MREAYRLTARAVQTEKRPGRYPDGAGLYLNVGKSGSRSWVLIFRSPVHRIADNGKQVGKKREMGLGPVDGADAVSLAAARSRARELRTAIEAGTDPIDDAERQRSTAARSASGVMTVRRAFDGYFADKAPTLKSPKHAALWRSTLETYAFPQLGDRDVAEVTTRDVANVLRPIWREMPETAMRVHQRLKNVFDWAIASDYRIAGNPTLAVKAILGERNAKVVHHRALPYGDVPKLVRSLRETSGLELQTRLALEWMLLTVTRQSEARLAEWSEIDEAQGLWIVPEHRTKMSKEHVVPLPPRCLKILDEAKIFGRTGLIFPGVRPDRPLSENTLNVALKRLGLGEVTVAHGLRSTFRDWATEAAKAREVVAEAVLAHKVKDPTERAYRRALYLDERRELLARWADYAAGGQPVDNVVPFPRSA